MTLVVPLAIGVLTVVVALYPRRPGRRAVTVPATDVAQHEGRTLLDALEQTSREARAGTSLTVALTDALAGRPTVLATLRRSLEAGVPLAVALREAAPVDPAEVLAVQALHACVVAGGPTTETLDRTAAVLRERRMWAQERRSYGSQARLSAVVLTMVPIGFAGLGVVTSERLRTAYTSPVAVGAAAAGLALDGVGWWWMQRLIRSEP